MPRCVAPGCGNTNAAHLGMFSFPKDSYVNLKWRTNMRRAKSNKAPWKLWTNSERWSSILNHVVDIHEGHGSLYPNCQHEQLDDQAWIKKESKPHKELRDVINRQHLLKDIQKLSPAEQTYGLEAFHKNCCHFATKFTHFFYHSMECRLKLACLHYNENSNRAQNTTKTREPMWQVALPKFKKGQPVAKQVKVAATYDYVDKLMDEVLERREILPTYKDSRAELEPILAKTPKPVSSKYAKYDKAEVVAAHKSRFKILDSKQ